MTEVLLGKEQNIERSISEEQMIGILREAEAGSSISP